MGNILQWDGILSQNCLIELAVDSTLNRFILSALQSTDVGEDSVEKCKKVKTLQCLIKNPQKNCNLLLKHTVIICTCISSNCAIIFSHCYVKVVECFPVQWFSSLKGQQTLPQLENLCRFMKHMASSLYRSSLTASDVDKRIAR